MLIDVLERLAFALVALTSTALTEGAPGADLTFPQWRVLVVLGGGDGGRVLRLGVLAVAISASRPSTSRLVRRLERRGLVQTTPDPDDRRGLLVGLSDRGRTVRAAVIDRRRELIRERIAGLSGPAGVEQELERVADALDDGR